MKKTITLFCILPLIYLRSYCVDPEMKSISCEQVNNIILLIGDGMGTAQIYAAMTVNKGTLNIERAQYIGFSKTYSANSYNTDSGAGGTAISSGYKTNNYSIGIDKTGVAKETILEYAEKKGLSTGMVVTSSVTHATPASFIAHVNSRFSEEAIAENYIHSGIDIVIGGGRKFFENRSDSINLFDSLNAAGYIITDSLSEIDISSNKKTGCFAAFNSLPAISNGRGDFLPNGVNIALNKLNKNEKGFFILVEGSQIDWGGHDNDLKYVTNELIDFDKAIGVAMDFADNNPGTLIIITADHETGGLALTNGDISKGIVEGKFSVTDHTGVMVPVFAYGTGASIFAGIYENTEIYHKMMCLLGFNEN